MRFDTVSSLSEVSVCFCLFSWRINEYHPFSPSSCPSSCRSAGEVSGVWSERNVSGCRRVWYSSLHLQTVVWGSQLHRWVQQLYCPTRKIVRVESCFFSFSLSLCWVVRTSPTPLSAGFKTDNCNRDSAHAGLCSLLQLSVLSSPSLSADHSGLVTGVAFGEHAQFLSSTGMDRSLKFYSL